MRGRRRRAGRRPAPSASVSSSASATRVDAGPTMASTCVLVEQLSRAGRGAPGRRPRRRSTTSHRLAVDPAGLVDLAHAPARSPASSGAAERRRRSRTSGSQRADAQHAVDVAPRARRRWWSTASVDGGRRRCRRRRSSRRAASEHGRGRRAASAPPAAPAPSRRSVRGGPVCGPDSAAERAESGHGHRAALPARRLPARRSTPRSSIAATARSPSTGPRSTRPAAASPTTPARSAAVAVTDVRKEGDLVWHTLDGDAAPTSAPTVDGEVDWDRRHAADAHPHRAARAVRRDLERVAGPGDRREHGAAVGPHGLRVRPAARGLRPARRGAGQRRAGRRPADRGRVPAARRRRWRTRT